MDELASRYNIGRTEMPRRFGAGTMERARLEPEETTAARLKQQYVIIAPQAETLLRQETAHY